MNVVVAAATPSKVVPPSVIVVAFATIVDLVEMTSLLRERTSALHSRRKLAAAPLKFHWPIVLLVQRQHDHDTAATAAICWLLVSGAGHLQLQPGHG